MGNSCTSVFSNRKNEIRQKKEDGKKRGVSIERSKAGKKTKSPDGLSHPNQNTIIINIIW